MGNLTKNTITRGAVIALALSAGAATTANAAVTRTAGANRYATATQIFGSWPTTTDTAVLAAGLGHDVDALTVAPLAKMKNAPILLVDTKDSATVIAAQFAKFKTVYIANGTGVIPVAVETALKAAGVTTVVRLGGTTRTDTALTIAKAIGTSNGIVVANGADAHLVDTLSIASIAAAKGLPIFLTQNGALSADEATYAKGLAATNVYALGGTTIVTDAAVAGLGTTVTRLAGADRYSTNAKVVTNFKASLDLSNVYIASGENANLIDSLTGAPLAGLKNAPIVFAHNSINADVNTLLNDVVTSTTNITVLGGVGAVSETVKTALTTIQDSKNPNLVVSSVSALNADQVKVVFTKAVNAGTTGGNAEDPTLYSVNNVAPAKAELQADGKSVILTLATNHVLVNGAAAIYVVHATPSSADTTVKTPEYATSQIFTDSTVPTILSIASTTNGTTGDKVTVTFSEPVSAGIIKIDGAMYNVTAGVSTDILGLALDVTKSHTLEVVNLTDYATDGTTTNLNKTAYASQTFNITLDKALPTATVSAYSDKAILVTFSKPVDNNTIDSVIVGSNNITVKDELLTNVNVTSIAKSTVVTDGTQYIVTIDPLVKLYSSVASRNLTLLFSANIKDTVGTGNALAAVTKTITLVKDTTAPTVTGITFTKNADLTLKDVTVTYSKGLKAQTIVAATALTVVDSNGLLVNTKFNNAVIAANATTAVFTAVANYTPTSILTFSAPTVTDNSETGNTSVAFSKNLNIATATTANTFTVIPAVAQLANKNKITIDYTNVFTVKGGAVVGSATDPSNYSINNKVLPAGTVIYLEAGQHKADITLPDGFITADDAAAVVRVNNVQTTDGLTIVPVVTTANLKENGMPVLTAAVLNADGTITATTSEALTLVNADLALVVNGVTLLPGSYTSTLINAGADKGKYLVTVNAIDNGVVGVGKFTFIETDGVAGFSGTDIKIATGAAVAAGAVDLKGSAVISTITVGTTTGTATSADANGNTLKTSTTLTVK